ncbi:MAG: hypothetical protein HDT26_01340 [Subdoligranulum sp.]|nr:hypothetical protein [Subdoligranulum sp.]
MPTKKQCFTVILDEDLFNRIDDIRYEKRYRSRSAVAVELIRLGLEQFELREAAQRAQEAKPSGEASD